jgi:hypothetical protein
LAIQAIFREAVLCPLKGVRIFVILAEVLGNLERVGGQLPVDDLNVRTDCRRITAHGVAPVAVM